MATKTKVKRPRRSKLSGSVRVRGNSKSLMFTYGKRQYSKSVDTSLTLTEARKLLPAFIHDIMSGAHGARMQAARALSEAPTWNECVVAFLADHMPVDPDGESKRHAYAYGLGLLAQEFGERRVGDIKEAALRRLFRALHQSGRTRPTKAGSVGLSVATVRMVYAVAARMFRQLTKDVVIPTNPMPRFADLELGHGEPASERARRSALSHGQVAMLIDACRPDPALCLWVTIMAATGMRPGEALGLRWRDLGARGITVSGSVKRGDVRGQGRLGATKSRKVRTIPLSPELGALMIAERDRQETILRQLHGLPDNVAPLQPQLAPDDFILPADPVDRRHPPSIRAMRSRVERKAAAIGLTGVTAHWLRHTTASAMLAGTDTEPGISVVDAAALLGHANPLTTARTYAHASATNMQRGASLAAHLIAPAPAAPVERLLNSSARTSDTK